MEERKPLGCFDCGLAYGGIGWCDVLIPNWAWVRISNDGTTAGILCFNCMARRLERAELREIPVAIVSGPFTTDDPGPRFLEQEDQRLP